MTSILLEKSESEMNTHRGGYNESRFAYHMNGGKHINKEHRDFEKHHKTALDNHHPHEAKQQDDRAKAQVKSFVDHHKKKGYHGVDKVHLTMKPGDIEKHTGIKASQQENPSDVVVKFKRKPKTAEHHYVGASLKSSKSKKIGFHNGGLEVTAKKVGVHKEVMKTVKDRHEHLKKQEKLHSTTSTAAKQIAGKRGTATHRSGPKYDRAMKHTSETNTMVRDHLHKGYQKMHHEHLKNHLVKTFLKATHSHALPYVKTHGQGGGSKPAAAHTEDPHDNEHYHAIKKAKKLEVKKSGGSLMSVHADGKKIFHMQVKHNNGPLTSMKVIGQP